MTEAAAKTPWWMWLLYGAAIFAPLLGVVGALAPTARREWQHVVGLLLVAFAAFLIRFVLLAHGTDTGSTYQPSYEPVEGFYYEYEYVEPIEPYPGY